MGHGIYAEKPVILEKVRGSFDIELWNGCILEYKAFIDTYLIREYNSPTLFCSGVPDRAQRLIAVKWNADDDVEEDRDL